MACDDEYVVARVEKRLLGRHADLKGIESMGGGEYERLLIRQAERAAARLRASRLARRPAGAENVRDATKGRETA